MNKLIFVMLAVALLSASVYLLHQKKSTVNQITANIGIPATVLKEYLEWKMLFGKSYTSDYIEAYKISVFFENWMKLKQHDEVAMGYSVAANQFMDMTSGEFKATMLTAIPITNIDKETPIMSNEDTSSAPASVNWVTAGKVSAVKNQGQCGSCWAFSTTGANESDDAIFGSGVGDFSEQQLVDCSSMYGNQGCNGGNYFWANKYVMKYGITTEQAYPYTGVTGKCKTQGGAWKITSQTLVTAGSCPGLQNAIAQQPTSVQVDATNWQFYSSGVFKNCGTQIDHDVLAVGYTSTYWLIKNSWGVSWGMQGYIQLALGNTCGVCSQTGYPNK